jgi:hypothetical protein
MARVFSDISSTVAIIQNMFGKFLRTNYLLLRWQDMQIVNLCTEACVYISICQ